MRQRMSEPPNPRAGEFGAPRANSGTNPALPQGYFNNGVIPSDLAKGMNMQTALGAQQDVSLQQRLFGALNEAGTNVSRVPMGLTLPGQSYAFQHARFAVSGTQLAQALAQHAAGQYPMVGNMLNHPGVMPIYRPDLSIAGLNPPSMTLPNAVLQPGAPGSFGSHPNGMLNGIPNFASVVAQPMPRNEQVQMFYSQAGVPNANGMRMMSMSSGYQARPTQSMASSSGDLASASSPSRTGEKRDRTVVEDGGRKKRRRRDPSLPTPARFAWNFFFREQYTKIRNAGSSEHSNVQKAFTDIGLDLGKKWKALSKEEKIPYIKLAQQDRERYEREMRERFAQGKDSGAVGPSSNSVESNEDGDELDEEESAELEDEVQTPPGKVGIVLHQVQIEDTRKEEERSQTPTEGELVADVLVVDDDEVFLKIISHKLVVNEKNPLRVVTVNNAEEAKRMLVDEKKKFGTVLLDKNFGDGHTDGISSLKCIRENGYRGVIVGVTVSEDEITREEFAKSGADNTFIKGSLNFYDDMAELIKLHRANAELVSKSEGSTQASVASTTAASASEAAAAGADQKATEAKEQ